MKVPFAGPISLREGWPDLDSFSEVFVQGVYDGAVGRVPDCRRIIDLGAHIGLATLFFAIRCPKARIASVEPHPANYQMMTENLRPLITAGKCVPIPAAVWSTERWLQPDPTRPLERFNAFAVQESNGGQEGSLRVEGMSVPAIMKKASFDTVDLMKVDIEGSEVELFRKNTDWLASVRALAIEFHGSSRSECGFDDTMRRYGFTIHDEGSHTVVATKHQKPD
jgi:FkbM family methyltransferase